MWFWFICSVPSLRKSSPCITLEGQAQSWRRGVQSLCRMLLASRLPSVKLLPGFCAALVRKAHHAACPTQHVRLMGSALSCCLFCSCGGAGASRRRPVGCSVGLTRWLEAADCGRFAILAWHISVMQMQESCRQHAALWFRCHVCLLSSGSHLQLPLACKPRQGDRKVCLDESKIIEELLLVLENDMRSLGAVG